MGDDKAHTVYGWARGDPKYPGCVAAHWYIVRELLQPVNNRKVSNQLKLSSCALYEGSNPSTSLLPNAHRKD
jgi:hypothetical protein